MAKFIFNSAFDSENLTCNHKDIISMTVSKCGKQGLYFKSFNSGTRFDPRPQNNELLFSIKEKSGKFSNYKVTVTYHDEGFSHFALFYKNSAGVVKKTELVELSNTNEWKTKTFILEDIPEKPSYKKYDFAISIFDVLTGKTKDGMTFGEVSVEACETTSPIKVKLSTPQMSFGNFFAIDKRGVEIIAKIENLSDKDEDVILNFTSTNLFGKSTLVEKFDLKIGAGEILEKVLNFFPEYSLFEGKLTVQNDNIYSSDTIKYAYIIGTDKKNDKIGINSHSIRLDTRKVEILAPLMRKLGYSAVRDGLWQDFTYGEKAGLSGPFAPNDYHRSVLDTYSENNIDWLQLILWENRIQYWAHPHLNGGKISDAENEEANLNFIKDSTPFTKEKAKSFEFLNECNMYLDDNGKNIYSGKWYGEFLKRAYKVLKDIAPDHQVIAGVTSYIDFNWLGEMFDAADGCFDSVSVHPYTFITGPDEVFEYTYYGHIKKFRDFMNERGLSDKPITVTEVGFPTQRHYRHPEYTHTELEQAAYLAELYNIYQTDYLNIDKVYFYDFQSDGPNIEELEDNLGIINTWDTVEYPYLAKPAALSMGWMNDALAGAKYLRRIDEDNLHLYFHDRNDKKVIVLWAKEGTRKTDLSIKGDYTVYDMFGNEIKKGADSVDITLDYMPKYIIGDFCDFEVLK